MRTWRRTDQQSREVKQSCDEVFPTEFSVPSFFELAHLPPFIPMTSPNAPLCMVCFLRSEEPSLPFEVLSSIALEMNVETVKVLTEKDGLQRQPEAMLLACSKCLAACVAAPGVSLGLEPWHCLVCEHPEGGDLSALSEDFVARRALSQGLSPPDETHAQMVCCAGCLPRLRLKAVFFACERI